MRTSRILAIGAAAALAIGLSACASSAPESTSTAGGNPASDDAFPVTVEHVYGETTITEKPERVATVAWANHEVPLALGIVPVGMSKAAWGDDDDNGVLPWVEEKLDELGAETPVLFDETDGIDYEAVADTEPDVIPRRLLRSDPGGVRHPLQDRPGHRLPEGRLGHLGRRHDRDGLQGPRPREGG